MQLKSKNIQVQSIHGWRGWRLGENCIYIFSGGTRENTHFVFYGRKYEEVQSN